MNRDDVTRLERLVKEAALHAGVSRDDATGLQRLVNEVALRAGVSVDEVVSWSVARFQRYIADVQVQLDTEMRANLRRAIALERITTLTEVAGMPADMTVDEAIGQGIITAEQVNVAQQVTEADIDVAIAQVEAAHEVTETDIDAAIAKGELA